MLGQSLLMLIAATDEVAVQRGFAGAFHVLVVLEQKRGIDCRIWLISEAVWRHARMLLVRLQAVSLLVQALDVFDVDLPRHSLVLLVEQVEILLSVVHEKGDASFLFERALLHVQSHCHFRNV